MTSEVSPEVGPAPVVSVVIATKDRLAFLKEAVGSVATQTLPACETIVVDDGSSDGSAEWLIQHESATLKPLVGKHIGRGAASNRGLELASAPYVLFLDDDDRLLPSALQQLLAGIRSHPGAVGAVGARVLFDGGGNRRRLPHPRRPLVRTVWTDLLAGWMSPPGTILWRTDVIRTIGGWNEQIMVGGMGIDRELLLRAARLGPVVLVPHLVLEKRTHRGQWRAEDARQVQQRWMRAYIDALPPDDRALAVRLTLVRRLWNDGRVAYEHLEASTGLRLYSSAIRLAPRTILTSPLLRPMIGHRALKALYGTLFGRASIVAARRAKGRIRRFLGRDVEEVKERKARPLSDETDEDTLQGPCSPTS